MDTQRQNFWKESIDNEVTIRNKWFQEHMSNGIKLNMDNEPAKSRKIIKVQPLELKTAAPPKPLDPKPVTIASSKSAPKMIESEMRIASAKTKNMLYTGLSAEGDGRKAYLLQRKIKGPEQKYTYPLTSALEVGWKIREVSSHMEGKPAQFGRSRIVQDTFFRTNGCF